MLPVQHRHTLSLICALATALLMMPSTAAGRLCAGDCNDDRFVSVDELVNGVLIVQGERPLNSCEAFDVHGDHEVTIDELLQAVNHTLERRMPVQRGDDDAELRRRGPRTSPADQRVVSSGRIGAGVGLRARGDLSWPGGGGRPPCSPRRSDSR